jgi:hypothetical protein
MILKTAVLEYLAAIQPQVLKKNQPYLAKAIMTWSRKKVPDTKKSADNIATFSFLLLSKLSEVAIDANLEELHECCTHLKPTPKRSFKSKR